MSQALIRAALEKHLTGMTQLLDTAFENVTYTPKADVPFQKVNLLPAATVTRGHDGKTSRETGVFQVTLMYPQNKGVAAAQARAELIRRRFAARTFLDEAGVRVEIDSKPSIASAFIVGDRYAVPVSINYTALVTESV